MTNGSDTQCHHDIIVNQIAGGTPHDGGYMKMVVANGQQSGIWAHTNEALIGLTIHFKFEEDVSGYTPPQGSTVVDPGDNPHPRDQRAYKIFRGPTGYFGIHNHDASQDL